MKGKIIYNSFYIRFLKTRKYKVKALKLFIIAIAFSFLQFHSNIAFAMKKRSMEFDIIIPAIEKDIFKIFYNYKYLKRFINNINDIIIIGDDKVEQIINKRNFSSLIKFINEKKIIDVNHIKKIIFSQNQNAKNRAGWYVQQFIKMKYCWICNKKYYLIWDGDTIPSKHINMFNKLGKPFFDVKTEFHKPYFITMEKLIPELKKKNNYSFISEHLLIETIIMKDLINRIKKNTNIPGKSWYEKIIMNIDKEQLPGSGFSEFETYGTFANEFYKDTYIIRHWKSIRNWAKMYNGYNYMNITEKFIEKIGQNYDSITFEKL